jgi:hypothetical protein
MVKLLLLLLSLINFLKNIINIEEMGLAGVLGPSNLGLAGTPTQVTWAGSGSHTWILLLFLLLNSKENIITIEEKP